MSIDPYFFGPIYWRIINQVCVQLDTMIHKHAIRYLFQLFQIFIYLVALCLPCVYCKESLRMLLSHNPVYNATTSITWDKFEVLHKSYQDYVFRRYSYELRMAVNTKLMWSCPEVMDSILSWEDALKYVFVVCESPALQDDIDILKTRLSNTYTPRLIQYVRVIFELC